MKKNVALFMAGLLTMACVGCGNTTTVALESPSTSAVESTVDASLAEADTTTPETTDVSESSDEEIVEEDPTAGLFLRQLYAEHNMKVGTCVSPMMLKNEKIKQIIVDQFSSVTAENAMKPDSIFNKSESKTSGDLVVEFSQDALNLMEFAKQNGLSMRGHTLIWYSQTPNWIFYEDFNEKGNLVSRDVMLARMESYIKQVFEKLDTLGYADLFYAYDVANEAWMEDGSLRENNWSKTIGDDYLWYAFYYADKYAPEHIDLYYNDYNEQFKTDTLLSFADTLKDDNGEYLIDGIGFQAHLYTQDSLTDYFKTVDAIAATGLKVQLTELDVCLGAWQNTLEPTDDNLKVQGQFYYNLINGLLERVDNGTLNMDALTFWGFADGLSWRKEASPLLYDTTYNAKYSYFAAMQIKEKAGFDE